MATFGQWLADQQERQDQIGSAARFWQAVTPGRISSPSGMIRHLERQVTADADDTAVKAAIEGIKAANDEYGRVQLTAQAEKAGLRVVRDAVPADVQQQAEQPSPDGFASTARPVFASAVPRGTAVAPGSYELVTDEQGKPQIAGRKLPHPEDAAARDHGAAVREQAVRVQHQLAGASRAGESQLDRIERKLDTVLAVLRGSGLQALAVEELSQAVVQAFEQAQDERVTALWLRRDGTFDWGQLHALADLAAGQ